MKCEEWGRFVVFSILSFMFVLEYVGYLVCLMGLSIIVVVACNVNGAAYRVILFGELYKIDMVYMLLSVLDVVVVENMWWLLYYVIGLNLLILSEL